MKKSAPSSKSKLTLDKTTVKDLTTRSSIRAGMKCPNLTCYDTCVAGTQCIGSCMMTG
jgi:hypothetical protein